MPAVAQVVLHALKAHGARVIFAFQATSVAVCKAIEENRTLPFYTQSHEPVEVVIAGSLTAAATRLNLAKTVVGPHIQRLETAVGVSLLTRATRRLNVTEAGCRFCEPAREMLMAGSTAPMRATLRDLACGMRRVARL
jgi:hypothetical protein